MARKKADSPSKEIIAVADPRHYRNEPTGGLATFREYSEFRQATFWK